MVAAQVVATPLVSWARMPICSRDKWEYAPEMASFTYPATVPLEAFLYGSFEIMNRAFSAPRRSLVSFRYHFSALSGQCTLSSGECSFRLSRNTELGVKEEDWFLSSKREGRRRTPPFSHLRWLGSIRQEWTQLTRLVPKYRRQVPCFFERPRLSRHHEDTLQEGREVCVRWHSGPVRKSLVYGRNGRSITCKGGRG